ncbi:MAG: glycine betaine/proline transport system permease protein [Verrucomicrobiota bacterium]|jgi:glycine betaine/proline transport system permease protein|nr:glycine betaine/proline transport system permease protein [Verrucomicrobiota bacterium]MDK2963033.1 glycine betaine/proline transport system permease protein [Verrucomicrobiota bacterium]
MNIPRIPVGKGFEVLIQWLTDHLSVVFDGIDQVVLSILGGLKFALLLPHPLLLIALFTALAWWMAQRGVALFTGCGMLLIYNMGYWTATMETLSLVLAAVLIALLVGIPLGICTAKSDRAERVIRPMLDFMQTLPAFVYLIPAVLFFKLGPVPGVIATLIFSLPPVVRLTGLGIRQVPPEIREAAVSFGSSPRQLLLKAELPMAMPTIMAGVNQTIMLALSMVVISGMIGAGGLGNEVLKGITQLRIDVGFEAGISIVILAIFLDRVTQQLGKPRRRKNSTGRE